MSYELSDANGSVGPLATISGYRELTTFLKKHGGSALQQLVRQGYALQSTVAEELRDLETLDATMSKSLQTTLSNLKELVAKAEDIVIVGM